MGAGHSSFTDVLANLERRNLAEGLKGTLSQATPKEQPKCAKHTHTTQMLKPEPKARCVTFTLGPPE